LFARLREGAVGHVPLPLPDANAGRGRDGVQRRSAQILPLLVELMRQRRGLGEALLALALGPGVFVGVDEEHVFHRLLLANGASHRRVCWIVVRGGSKSTGEANLSYRSWRRRCCRKRRSGSCLARAKARS